MKRTINMLNNMIEEYEFAKKSNGHINHHDFLVYRDFVKSLYELRELMKKEMFYYNQNNLFKYDSAEILSK